jgi:glucose-1-phosphate thymidylyltransferase
MRGGGFRATQCFVAAGIMVKDGVIGLIPCAGRATRIAPLPCSKEVLPVGFRTLEDGSTRVKVVSHYLLDQMRRGGVRRAFFILRNGKWDIPEYFGDGRCFGLDLGYLMMGSPYGPAYTLNQAYPFVRGSLVAFGFPDILFEPRDAFTQALARLNESRAALVLVLCRVPDPRVHDMVRVDAGGRVLELVIKPHSTDLQLGWILAVWAAEFTEFMHDFLTPGSRRAVTSPDAEVTVGEVIREAVHEGFVTQTVAFPQHAYLDIGTPEGLSKVYAGLRCNFPGSFPVHVEL